MAEAEFLPRGRLGCFWGRRLVQNDGLVVLNQAHDPELIYGAILAGAPHDPLKQFPPPGGVVRPGRAANQRPPIHAMVIHNRPIPLGR
jgi:hypothetical protein